MKMTSHKDAVEQAEIKSIRQCLSLLTRREHEVMRHVIAGRTGWNQLIRAN